MIHEKSRSLFFLGFIILLGSCKPRVIPKTATEDDLAMYRTKYIYERPIFDDLSMGIFKVYLSTATDDDLSIHRKKYTYTREKLDSLQNRVLLVSYVVPDFTWETEYDVTKKIDKILNYVPKKRKYSGQQFKKRVVQGFRIQIYRGRSRNEATKIRSNSFGLLPKYHPYLIYEKPSYRVQVGDFINEQECQSIYQILHRKFPTALIVPAMVNVIVEKNR